MADFITITEAANKLGCSATFLQRQCREGKILAVRVGKNYRVREADLDAWVRLTSCEVSRAPIAPKAEPGEDLLNLLDGWIAFLTHVKALAPATIRSHQWCLRSYLKRMAALSSQQVTCEALFQRKAMMAVFARIPAASFALKLNIYNAIMSFGRYLVGEGKLSETLLADLKPLKPRRQSEPHRTCLKPTDVPRLFDAILTRPHSIADNIAFAAIVACMVYAGLRVSEVMNLRAQDVDMTARVLTIRHGKGGKDRRVGISQSLMTYLEPYHQNRPDGASYFITPCGAAYDRRMIQKRLTAIARRLRLDITCHGLRRTFATLASNNGRSLDFVRLALGHTNIATTQAYIRTSEEDVIASMRGW